MGKREDARARIEAQIVEVGRRHLVTDGPAGLSLRAIARELGMVSSAVYRYVASRDDLLTLLLVDAYGELAEQVDRTRGAEAGDWQARLLAIAHAARGWATSQPARWALLYGSPVPGYHAPAERTVIPGTRVVQAIFDTVAVAVADGGITVSKSPAPQPLSSDLERLRAEFGFDGPDDLMVRCTALWAGLVGAISLEVFGQYGPETFRDPAGVFDLQMRMLIDMLAASA
ncbi:TetR/AcrR family transcriptional regulator [Mycolicibacterium sp. F2034L]|uniref:TetR/AcrR family transcriptional regulator n=1 Tax=Mycolicibacterium sp. F2034L TaxID=2926422 RepID=UPI001FF35BA1|nr:TetR/AcrR family transcriptional regulator [Mycolicibacterium sp. F2034L]MCK0174034.1 TetR/AcrR family transcriptional regulator [Mycolicibacterium sp. F2034L]